MQLFCVGSRMYEMKKEPTLKTLENMQTKVNEINNVLVVGFINQLLI